MRAKRFFYGSFVASLLLLGLTACPSHQSFLPKKTGLDFEKIDSNHAAYPVRAIDTIDPVTLQWLTKRHITLKLFNDQLSIIIPTDRFFDQKRQNTRQNYRAVIQKIAVLLNQYAPNHCLFITGYMGQSALNKVGKRYANHTAALLWAEGIAHRYLIVKDANHDDALITLDNDQTRLARRIEIRAFRCSGSGSG